MLFELFLTYANKIFNTWIEKHLPLTNKILLIPKKEEHHAKWKKYDDAQAKKENTRAEILTGIIKLGSHYKGSPDEDFANRAATILTTKFNEVEMLENCLQRMKVENPYLHQYEEKLFSIPRTLFDLYLDENTRTDDDIRVDAENLNKDQKECLKEIKRLITNTTAECSNKLATEKMLFFYLKIISVLQYALFEKEVKIDYKAIGKWLKIGVWILDKMNTFTKKEKKSHLASFYAENIRCIRILTASLYAHLAFHLVITPSPLSDFDLLLAETYLEDAIEIAQGINHFTVVTALKYCTQAKLALEREEIDEFLLKYEQAEKRVPQGTYYYPFFIILKCIGDYFAKKDPEKAFLYYEKALRQSALCNIDHDMLLIQGHVNHMKEYCEEKRKAQTTKLISELKKAFTDSLVNVNKNNLLCIFIPLSLNELPKNTRDIGCIKIMKIWCNESYKGKNQVGITFTSNVKNTAKNIISDIHLILNPQQKKSTPSPARDNSLCLSNNNMQFPPEKESVQPGKAISSPSLRKPKIKTRKAYDIIKTSESVSSNQVMLTAKEMGFIFPDSNFNPPVTPVYCTKEAQQRQCPQILVRWEDVSGLDTPTKTFFQNMLNPYLEGVLTAKHTKSGFKLHQYPENLKENWGRCGLRLKRRGDGGSTGASLRIVAIPEMKVTVEKAEKQIHRYLFKLGKYVHK